jgi:hypothetical protein
LDIPLTSWEKNGKVFWPKEVVAILEPLEASQHNKLMDDWIEN